MSVFHRAAAIASIVLAISTLCCGSALAETVYQYDFDNTRVTTGTLNGQDNWARYGTTSTYLQIANDTTGVGGYDWGNFVNNTSSQDSRSYRLNDGNWGYTLHDDADFDFSAVMYVSATNKGSAALISGSDSLIHFGVNVTQTNLRWCWFAGFGANGSSGTTFASYAHGLTSSTAAALRVGMSVEYNSFDAVADTYSYTVTPYFTNLNTGVTTTLTSLAQTLSVDSTSSYLASSADSIYIHNDQSLLARFDGFRIADYSVPEPSAIAMLAAGLIGLLAYAWRKRK